MIINIYKMMNKEDGNPLKKIYDNIQAVMNAESELRKSLRNIASEFTGLSKEDEDYQAKIGRKRRMEGDLSSSPSAKIARSGRYYLRSVTLTGEEVLDIINGNYPNGKRKY